MMNNTQTFSQLKREQKEAIGLLSIGTFLEYFDLMLYVHMAVLLNDRFFPKTDPNTAQLIAACAFCATFVLRPVGALIFGWIGDNIGRKATVIITTFMMSISCIIIANLPTYDQIGITATYIVTACRIIQSISSMGEVVGAKLYVTEITKPPASYPLAAFIVCMTDFGGMIALVIASFATTQGLNWRIAFWIGAGIALIGAIARTTLRETPEFADVKCRIRRTVEKANEDPKILENNAIWQEKVSKKTSLAYFAMHCPGPIAFYITFFYCSQILVNIHGYTPAQVIHHNLFVSIVSTFSALLFAWLSYKIYPLKILIIELYFSIILILTLPYILYQFNTPIFIFILQISFVSIFLPTGPAVAIFHKHFPVIKRFSYSSMLFALSHTFMYISTAFGIAYLTKYFNYWGLWVILIPIIIGCWFGLSHFVKLEKETGNYPQ